MAAENTLMVSADRSDCVSANEPPFVLGAGGWNIFHHFGVLDSINQHGIKFGPVLGVSAGGVAAAFITNGYSACEMFEIFLEIVRERNRNTELWRPESLYDPAAFMQDFFGIPGKMAYWMEAVSFTDPLSLMLGGPLSLRTYYRDLVEKYNLKPNPKLKLLASDFFTKLPYVYEGEDYDLAEALTATGAVPGVYQPVWHFDHGRFQLLVDGAIYHYSPTEFTEGPCIVSKFKPASAPPREWKTPFDLYFHYRELMFPLAGNNRYVDADKHLVIESGLPYVAALNNGLSEATLHEMVKNGRETANRAIEQAQAAGRFCS